MPTAKINGIELYYEVRGEGLPLLLIAGLASDSQSWQSIPGELARHRRVITFDHRGVGRTAPLNAEISIQRMADDCISLIRHLGLPSVDMLGHSMGGFTAQDCAIRYPEAVGRLILAGTAARNSARNNALFSDWAAYLESGMDLRMWFRNTFCWVHSRRWFEDAEVLEEAIRLAVDYPYPPDKVAFRNQVKALAAFNSADQISRIAAKTLVIAGKEDPIFPPDECAALALAIPGADYCLIEDAAHAIHLDNPEAFTASVLQFLSK